MAIVATGLTSGTSGTGSSLHSFQTVTISPTPGRVYLLHTIVIGKVAEGGTTSASGCGLTWTEQGHQIGTGSTLSRGRLTLFVGSGTPSSGKLTFSWVTDGGAYLGWSVVEVNGISGVRQLSTAAATDTVSPHKPTITLGSFASASNGTYGGFVSTNNIQAITPGTGFTQIHDAASAVNFVIFTEYRADNDTTVDITQVYGGNLDFISSGFELVAGVAGTQTVIPDAVASAVAIGTPQVNVSVAPTGIASEEALGTVTLSVGSLTVSPTGIASAGAIGTAAVTGGEVSVAPSSVASAEAFGTLQVNLHVTPDSIASEEDFGTLEVSQVLVGALVSSEETLTALVEGFDQ